ncbi:MAG: hypothetical protein D6731_06555 [Planctomycetota bacterium]|nr:MAG: hypothetical protein D6731_06555 [Planctomycetota bacterium]
MSTIHDVFFGLAVNARAVRVATSLGQRSTIACEDLSRANEWIELAAYGVPLPEKHRILACIALPGNHPRSGRLDVLDAARAAGWDAVLVVNTLHAAGRGLRARSSAGEEDLPLVVVDAALSSVGILRGRPLGLLDHDAVHSIAGREAREVAVSLRILLKQRPREVARALLRRVVVVGDGNEVERVGRRLYERELEALGAQQVDFDLDPFLIAQGALALAQETESQTWRRLRRRWARG